MCKFLEIIFYPFIVYFKKISEVFRMQLMDDDLFNFERRQSFFAYLIDNFLQILLYSFLILSIFEFYTKSNINFKDSNKKDDLKDRAILAY